MTGQNQFCLYDRLLMVPDNCPCLCLCKLIFWSVCSEPRGHECGMPSHVLFSFGNDKGLSETTTPYRQIYPWLRKTSVEIYHEPTCLVEEKRQAYACRSLSFFVLLFCVNVIQEATKLCRHRQRLIGDNKALPETTKLFGS
jgi:hypothetical protein